MTSEMRPIERSTLAQSIADRLQSLIREGKFQPGDHLPPERTLARDLGVGRSTIREALQLLAAQGIIDARPGRGTIVTEGALEALPPVPQDAPPPAGLLPLPPSQDTRRPVLRIPDLRKDRLGTFSFISWWKRDTVRDAQIMVVGAGALGNEVLKNLALMGVGHLFIIDFDTVEMANLSRSVLFRPDDNGKKKAEIAARRIKELSPDTRVQYFHGDVTTSLGLGVFRRMDVIVGCLDNREARLAVNRFCYWLNKPWVDGAIHELFGLARVFVPGQGACYECTLTEQARREMALRYSCPLLARQNVLLGKVPTTPTISSIIGGFQSQEALKLLHGLPVEAGKVLHVNGLTNETHITAYVPREDCQSHWTYGTIDELPGHTAAETTLAEMLRVARGALGDDAMLELDQELVLSLECHVCQTTTEVLRPVSQVTLEEGHCPGCGELRQVHMAHVITGDEAFLDRTLLSIGVPPLHIVRARNSEEYRFFELTGDLPTALHFAHLERVERDRPRIRPKSRPRITLGEYVPEPPLKVRPAPRLKVKLSHAPES
ncbi:MAG: ThiF family adenylyltransferase [Chloroflexi bacterium]|nr:ThiF family adenylyltransferase [Chloroflexota bacterium]MBU1751663.1 ThiF family adenylyltransferase [Chloroflexota bacterium]